MHLPSLGLLSAFQSLRPVGCGHLQVQPIAFFIQHNLARAPKGDVPSDLYSLDSDAFRALAEKLVQEFSFPEAKEVETIFPRFYHSLDRAGRPMYFASFSSFCAHTLLKVSSIDRLVSHHIRETEKLKRIPACNGNSDTRALAVLDLKNAPFSQFLTIGMKLFYKFERILDHYDDMYSHIILVNSPPLFVYSWNVFRRIVRERSANKILILGQDYHEELKKFARSDDLPLEYGGSCRKCPGGCSVSDRGPWNHASDAQAWCFTERDKI